MGMKKSGVWIIACALVLVGGSLLQAKEGKNTKIYTVFNSRVVTGASYSIYHPNVRIIKNKQFSIIIPC